MKKCKHNRLKSRLLTAGKLGKQHGYCTQCQRWVDVMVKKEELEKPTDLLSKERE